MARPNSRQAPASRFFPVGRQISLTIILVLCNGTFVCWICCASSRCCSFVLETGSRAGASAVTPRDIGACDGPSCEKQTHQRQACEPGEKLSKPIERSQCCSGEARTDSPAVLTQWIDNRLVATNVTGRSAECETVEPRFQIGRPVAVMNRGRTYLRFCVLLI